MKKVLSIALFVVILVLCWFLYRQFADPMEFAKERAHREAAVIQRLKDIRTAQRAFKQQYLRYTASFDTLINFVLHDSMTYQMMIGSEDDSVAVAKGLVKVEKFKMAVKDTIFSGRNFTDEDIKAIRIIPFSNNKEFYMGATNLVTESTVEVPVFEARAPYKEFLVGLDEQELINLVDYYKRTLERYAGLKVGSLTEATNDAGNWE